MTVPNVSRARHFRRNRTAVCGFDPVVFVPFALVGFIFVFWIAMSNGDITPTLHVGISITSVADVNGSLAVSGGGALSPTTGSDVGIIASLTVQVGATTYPVSSWTVLSSNGVYAFNATVPLPPCGTATAVTADVLVIYLGDPTYISSAPSVLPAGECRS